MALNNIAFAYSQIGDGNSSKKYYERILIEFPDSGIASSALKFLESADNIQK